jgi:hypothetical protein
MKNLTELNAEGVNKTKLVFVMTVQILLIALTTEYISIVTLQIL